MIHIQILAIGKLKEPHFRLAEDEYLKRLGAYATINVVELAEAKLDERPSTAQIKQGLQLEGTALLKRIRPDDYVVVLDRLGQAYTSEEYALRLDDMMQKGKSSLIYILGSSFGLSDEVKARADEKITLSTLTFPHQLARVIWLEQLYRAFKILRHETYHK